MSWRPVSGPCDRGHEGGHIYCGHRHASWWAPQCRIMGSVSVFFFLLLLTVVIFTSPSISSLADAVLSSWGPSVCVCACAVGKDPSPTCSTAALPSVRRSSPVLSAHILSHTAREVSRHEYSIDLGTNPPRVAWKNPCLPRTTRASVPPAFHHRNDTSFFVCVWIH